jgi:hypothetical protein
MFAKQSFFVHPQEDLAKFGYRPTMKVENFKNPLYFGYFAWNLL